jgi:hypothetical protein
VKGTGILTVSTEAVAVGIKGRNGVDWLECRPCQSPERLPELVDVLLARRELRSVRGVQVLLHSSMVQLRTLHSLPPVPQKQLPPLIRAQRRKFFPLGDGEILIDAVWADDGPDGRCARAVGADPAMIRILETAVERTGAALLGISPGGNGSERRLSLETPDGRIRRLTHVFTGLGTFALAAALAWAVAGGVYVADLAADRSALLEESTLLQSQLDQITSIRREIAHFAPIASAVAAQGPSAAWATRRLAAVARALPDSAHLLHYNAVRNGRTRLDVRAAEPVGVVAAVSAALGEGGALEAPPREEVVDDRRWYRLSITVQGRHDRP